MFACANVCVCVCIVLYALSPDFHCKQLTSQTERSAMGKLMITIQEIYNWKQYHSAAVIVMAISCSESAHYYHVRQQGPTA
jgi:hypothetical protein